LLSLTVHGIETVTMSSPRTIAARPVTGVFPLPEQSLLLGNSSTVTVKVPFSSVVNLYRTLIENWMMSPFLKRVEGEGEADKIMAASGASPSESCFKSTGARVVGSGTAVGFTGFESGTAVGLTVECVLSTGLFLTKILSQLLIKAAVRTPTSPITAITICVREVESGIESPFTLMVEDSGSSEFLSWHK
jgi:hypothetical protein